MDDLREEFRPRLVRTARERMQRAFALLGDPAQATKVEAELHALAGEAGLIGFADLAEAARTAELAARATAADPSIGLLARCARSVRSVARLVEALAAEDSPEASARIQTTAADELDCLAVVVDDSEIAREQIQAALAAAGMRVTGAASVSAALAVLASTRADVVLTDVNMPGMHDGVCAELKTAAGGAPVLLVSALGDAELASRTRAVGADGYASKKSGPTAIVERVRTALEARQR